MEPTRQAVVTAPVEAPRKLPYCAPKLTRYGELAALTQGGANPSDVEHPLFYPTSG